MKYAVHFSRQSIYVCHKLCSLLLEEFSSKLTHFVVSPNLKQFSKRINNPCHVVPWKIE